MPGHEPQEPSLYDVLQVRADASSRDIIRAYRRLARHWHPDARPADVGAAAQFRAVADAYDLLSDPVRRAAYDERQRRLHAARSRGAVPRPAARSPGAVPRPAARSPGAVPRPAARSRGPVPRPAAMPSPPLPLWPLGPATIGPATIGPATTGPIAPGQPGPPIGLGVWPGPVRFEPIPEGRAAGRPPAEARLLILAEFLRAYLGDRNRPW